MLHITAVLFKVFALSPLRSLNKRRILLIDAAVTRGQRLLAIFLQSAAELNRINKVIGNRIRTKLSLLCAPNSLTSLRTDWHVQTPKGQNQLLA